MMTLLVILYKGVQTIPDTVPKFYEELFDVLFYRHDHSKPGFRRKRFTPLDDGAVKRLFSAFCFYVRLQGLGVLSAQQFSDCCQKASDACGLVVNPTAMKDELVKTICLMQEDGFELSFIHKSVAQYYAASFVLQSSGEFAEKFYELSKSQGSWELELRFLSKIDRYRYTKYFELPLILSLARDVGISLSEPHPSDTDKLTAYLSETVSLVLEDIAEPSSGDASAEREFMGWTSKFERRDLIRRELVFFWISAIWGHVKRPAVVSRSRSSDGHTFLPVKDFLPNNAQVLNESATNALHELRLRYSVANNVIETEARKTALLSAFLT